MYFNQDPVLNVGALAAGGGRGGFGGPEQAIPGVGMNVTPMAGAGQQRLSPYDPESGPPAESAPARPSEAGVAAVPQGFGGGGGRGGRGGGGGGFGGAGTEPPRVVMRFPANPNDMLLSGTLAGGQALANRAQVVDVPLGQGHVVMFAIRPFWRWQTQGTYFLAFNAILNWNDLDAGRATESRRQTTDSTGR